LTTQAALHLGCEAISHNYAQEATAFMRVKEWAGFAFTKEEKNHPSSMGLEHFRRLMTA